MKKVSLDTWIQLLGMAGIIVSLIFVAMQMRQSHRFALAAQQQARMEVFVDAVNTMSETGVSFQDFQINGSSEANKIEVENFPAFVVVDDKGNDFFSEVSTPVSIR